MAHKIVLLLALVFAVYTNGNVAPNNQPECFPEFASDSARPDCTNEAVPGWVFWESMQYKFFPKKYSQANAEQFCKGWDEAVCRGENLQTGLYLAHLGSFVAEGELNDALLAAYNRACIQGATKFWTGATHRDSRGRLAYTDNVASNKHAFAHGSIPSLSKGTDCVAIDIASQQMVVEPCSSELPFVCKIQPNRH